MRHFHLTRQKYYKPTINVDRLWSLLPEDVRTKMLTSATREQAPVIDCVNAGYFKVLGNGELPKKPIIVKARFFSRKAELKIREAGGVCVTTA